MTRRTVDFFLKIKQQLIGFFIIDVIFLKILQKENHLVSYEGIYLVSENGKINNNELQFKPAINFITFYY